MSEIQRGIDTILKINDIAVAGQLNAILKRSMSPINITNQIKGEWEDSLAGTKTWSVSCGGAYVNGANSLSLLESAFMNNTEIEVIFSLGEKTYKGKGLITNFPLNANYNSQLKYTIDILGIGALMCE